jgi:E3 ubiquitin-protein ligase SHPRH
MQWFDEIDKHLRSSHLKVKIYRGINVDEFKPFDLASLDVCITTYEVLASELDHVFAFENMRELRKPKRYMNIPSPLVCINWWRVCLDEAQMVHSTQAKCAAMANRLAAVNRW